MSIAIAGILVIPQDRESETRLAERLENMVGVKVREIGSRGIAVVLEAGATEELKVISEDIRGWEEVYDLQLTYLNWEDLAKPSSN